MTQEAIVRLFGVAVSLVSIGSIVVLLRQTFKDIKEGVEVKNDHERLMEFIRNASIYRLHHKTVQRTADGSSVEEVMFYGTAPNYGETVLRFTFGPDGELQGTQKVG